MKKIFMTAAALLACVCMQAQGLEVEQIVPVPGAWAAQKAVLSADGSFVATYMPSEGGIVKIMVADGQQSLLAPGQNLYDIALSADGSQMVYSQATYGKDHLRKVQLQATNLLTGKTQTVVKASRTLGAGVAFNGNTVTAVQGGRARVKALDGQSAAQAPVATINYGHLDVTVDGVTTTIDPQGRGSYIWPSVSPDGTKVLYWLIGGGAFVCNLDGSNPVSLGAMRAPVWMGNDTVVAMDEIEGQAQQVTGSAIIAKNIHTLEQQVLTPYEMKAQYPSASLQAKKIAFTNPEGQIYIINLK